MVKAARPQTIEETVELANTLTDGLVRIQEENQKKNLAQRITQELHSGNSYLGKEASSSSTSPFCKSCKKKHTGKYARYCNFCKKSGHKEEECRNKASAKIRYNYGEVGHIQPNCPKLATATDNKAKAMEGPKKNVRAFVLTAKEAELIPDVIAGTFLSNNTLAKTSLTKNVPAITSGIILTSSAVKTNALAFLVVLLFVAGASFGQCGLM
ncbi:putative transcription factor interactor and regulator CCHC(Zn) family [Helianthus annuus]|nr:putative transcription factor interactor and regulator CCHC(Zn) family [Helianthus annuus]KAJ0645457.1 putative transcription factor interactor and regulator CCHC(Zn) family [Helianthus annuus]